MNELTDLLRAINEAPAAFVSQSTRHGVITPLLWTSLRNRDPEVAKTFALLIGSIRNGQFTDDSWHCLYNFLIASYKTKRIGSRLSVCEFLDRLRLKGVLNPGFFAGLYGASMGLLEYFEYDSL